jgi:hypothetical protein
MKPAVFAFGLMALFAASGPSLALLALLPLAASVLVRKAQ